MIDRQGSGPRATGLLRYGCDVKRAILMKAISIVSSVDILCVADDVGSTLGVACVASETLDSSGCGTCRAASGYLRENPR